jgi:hypothetical protein
MNITRAHAETIVELLGHGLVKGLGVQERGKMCVEAAVCYALGLPHSDDPGCVSPALQQLKIRLNDANWSSTMARADGLTRLALAQLGSKDVLNDPAFMRRVADVTIRRVVPISLRAVAQMHPSYATAMEACAVQCEQEGTQESFNKERLVGNAYAAANAAAYAAADASSAAAYAVANIADAAASAASYASCAAANADYDASSAASAAASAASYAASSAAYANASDDAYRFSTVYDRVLADYAEWIVEILIDMDAPGVQWLNLAPKIAIVRS